MTESPRPGMRYRGSRAVAVKITGISLVLGLVEVIPAITAPYTFTQLVVAPLAPENADATFDEDPFLVAVLFIAVPILLLFAWFLIAGSLAHNSAAPRRVWVLGVIGLVFPTVIVFITQILIWS